MSILNRIVHWWGHCWIAENTRNEKGLMYINGVCFDVFWFSLSGPITKFQRRPGWRIARIIPGRSYHFLHQRFDVRMTTIFLHWSELIQPFPTIFTVRNMDWWGPEGDNIMSKPVVWFTLHHSPLRYSTIAWTSVQFCWHPNFPSLSYVWLRFKSIINSNSVSDSQSWLDVT